MVSARPVILVSTSFNWVRNMSRKLGSFAGASGALGAGCAFTVAAAPARSRTGASSLVSCLIVLLYHLKYTRGYVLLAAGLESRDESAQQAVAGKARRGGGDSGSDGRESYRRGPRLSDGRHSGGAGRCQVIA